MISTPFAFSVVGWNCMNSMSFSGTPARHAIDMPSPVQAYALVVPRYMRPSPPVAMITAPASTPCTPPRTRSQAVRPTHRSPSVTRSSANHSS